VPGVRGRREQHIAEFPTTVRGLLGLRDWLAGHGVTQVVMEATGVYWKAPWAMEDEFDCLLVNARHARQVPGRKSDVSDAAWLCQLAEAGLVKANFVPPKPIRQLRNLTRYRKTQIQERAREVNRLHKALEDAGIKLDTVAADVMGKSGRDMLDALVAGQSGPHAVRKAMILLGAILRRAAEGRRIAYNPQRVVRRAPLPMAQEVRPPAPITIERMRAAAATEREAALLSVLGYAGLGPGELRILRSDTCGVGRCS
jgi:transposase